MTPEELRHVVATNIRTAAGAAKLPLAHLADRAPVGRAQLHSVLAGEKAPTTDWLARVASVLGVEPWELLRPQDPAEP